MRKNVSTVFRIARGANPGLLVLGILCIGLLAMTSAASADPLNGLTVIGIEADGTETVITNYRWLVEEDLTYHVPVDGAGVPQSDPDTLAVKFHRSYMPVHAKGCVDMPAGAACNELPFVDTASHYYVSVVPNSGYSIGGAVYEPGGTTVYCNAQPIPVAQISILIFEDNFPINNAPDLPGEDPANTDEFGVLISDMSGFQIIVEDAGGRYGASAGVQSQDAFGNLLGTTYQRSRSARCSIRQAPPASENARRPEE